jgi:hypothetical protein
VNKQCIKYNLKQIFDKMALMLYQGPPTTAAGTSTGTVGYGRQDFND